MSQIMSVQSEEPWTEDPVFFNDGESAGSNVRFDGSSGSPEIQPILPASVAAPKHSIFSSATSSLSPYRLQRHLEIRSKLAIEHKEGRPSLEDTVLNNFRSPTRKLYSRGHEVHEAGCPIAIRPGGSSPIMTRGHSTGTKMDFSKSLYSPSSRERIEDVFSRPTSRQVLRSGNLYDEEMIKPTSPLRYPLNSIVCTRASAIATNVVNASLPPDAFYILEDTKGLYLAQGSRQKYFDVLTQKDRVFIGKQRQVSRHSILGKLKRMEAHEASDYAHAHLLHPSFEGDVVEQRAAACRGETRVPVTASAHSYDHELMLVKKMHDDQEEQLRKFQAMTRQHQQQQLQQFQLETVPRTAASSSSRSLYGRPVAAPQEAPFKMDYSFKGSPERTKRPICKPQKYC